MKKFTILMSLFCLTIMAGSAFANNLSFEYDDFDNITRVSTPEGCVHNKNDFGFYNYSQGFCIKLEMHINGKWTLEKFQSDQVGYANAIKSRWSIMKLISPDWLFVEKVQVKINDLKVQLAGEFPIREVVSGGIIEGVRQKIDVNSRVYKQFWQPLANNKFPVGTPLKIRVSGQHYYLDFIGEI
jgi:hypothetical protein